MWQISKLISGLISSLITRQRVIRLRSRILIFLSFFLSAACALILNLSLNLSPNFAASPQPELRGVWLTNVDSAVLSSKANLQSAINRLHRLNFNTIYPTVWHEGYTLYPSAVAAKSFDQAIRPEPEFRNRDLLAEAVTMAHQKGMKVIPWFEFGLMSEEKAALTTKYPQWLTTRKDGSSVFVSGDRGQHRFVWLNPLRPEVQTLIVDLIVEIISKYDVDGIQLDDHFGMPAEVGYDDFTLGLYQQDHDGKLPSEILDNAEWTRWRAQQITDLMVKVSQAVKAVKPKAIISLSPNPKDFSYTHYLQDWHRWVKMGLIDELVIQVYRSDLSSFQKELMSSELAEIRQTVPVSIGILAGLRTQNVDIKQIEAQVKVTRKLGFHGFSFFFYETLGNRDPAFKTLLNSKLGAKSN